MIIQFKEFLMSLLMAATVPFSGHVATNDVNETACLTQAVYYEAAGEPLAGKIGVAHVIVNRSRSQLYPEKICDILKQRRQFSYLNRIGKIPDKPAVKEQIEDCMEASLKVLSGEVEDNTNGALYFVNLKTATDTKWLNGMKKTIKIGNHTFFKSKKSSSI